MGKFFASLKSLKKGVGSGVGSGSGSISQRYGSGDPDPDPQKNVTDPPTLDSGHEIYNIEMTLDRKLTVLARLQKRNLKC